MADPYNIDWSKIGSQSTSIPAIPQIDWSTIGSTPKPIAPVATPVAPNVPQIDWSKIGSAPQPLAPQPAIRPINSLNLSATESDPLDFNLPEMETPQIEIGQSLQLNPMQYGSLERPRVELGGGSEMLGKTSQSNRYDLANARMEDINLPANAPPLSRTAPVITPGTVVNQAKDLFGRVVGNYGEKPKDLNKTIQSEVAEPLSKSTQNYLNKTGVAPMWEAFNEPYFPEIESAPGDFLEQHLPFGGPLAKYLADVGMAGTTSPAGMLTLGGSAVLGAGLRTGGWIESKINKASRMAAAAAKAKQAARVIGPLTKEEALSPVTLGYRLMEGVEEAKLTRAEQKALYKAEQKARVKARAAVTTTGFEGYKDRSIALKGPLPKAPFKPFDEIQFNMAEREAMIDIIEGSKDLKQYDKQKAQAGLAKLMGTDIAGVPQKSELKLLEKAFPGISKIRESKTGILHGIGEFGGAARALEASMDLSFPGRQGIWIASRPQYYQSFKPMFKALSEEGYAEHIANLPKKFKHSGMWDRVKLDITDARNIYNSEEEYSSIIARLPGIKHSSYGYSAYGNEARASMFDDLVESAIQRGQNPYKNKKLAKEIASYINTATGRGDFGSGGLGKWMEKNKYIINQTLFSPKLMASRLDLFKRAALDPIKTGLSSIAGGVDLRRAANLPFVKPGSPLHQNLFKKLESINLPGIQGGVTQGIKDVPYLGAAAKKIGIKEYAQVDPFIRRQFWRDFLGYAATQTAFMAPFKVAQLMGSDVEFEMNPTNPNFGKVKMGNVRFDTNGGFQPYLRAFAQIAQREKTSSVSGKTTKLGEGYKPETTMNVLTDLLVGKASPIAAFGLDMLNERAFGGKEVSLVGELQNRLTPIIAQDMVAVLKENPRLAPLLVPVFFGASMSTYGKGDIKRQSKKSLNVDLPKMPKFSIKF